MTNKCARCNRTLINPPKMIGGRTYGPVCYRKLTTEVEDGHKRGESAESVQSLPFQTWDKYDEDTSEKN